MADTQRLVVFGASGRTGREVVAQALERGFQVRAFVRDPKSPNPAHNLSVIKGNVLEPAVVDKVVEGAGAVICCLGPSPDAPLNLCSQATANIVQAMLRHGVERLVCQTGAMIGHPNIGVFYRTLKSLSTVRRQIADRLVQEKIVEESSLEWTLVRPPRLTDGPLTHKYRTGESLRIGMMASISRKDVAAFMLDLLEEPHSHGKGLTICY